MARSWFSEYQYRQAFPGISHNDYLDEPPEAIQWLTRIHSIIKEKEAEMQEG